MWRSMILITVAGLLSSCSEIGDLFTNPRCAKPNFSALKTQLEQERALWKAQNISSYRVGMGISPSPAPSSFFELSIKNSTTFSKTDALTGEKVLEGSQFSNWASNIDEYFNSTNTYFTQVASGNGLQSCITISYDPKYHFIKSMITYPRDPAIQDGSSSTNYFSFRPLDAAYNQANTCITEYVPPDWNSLEWRLKEVKDRWSLQKLAGYRYRLQLLGFRPANDVWVTVKSGVVSDVRDFSTNLVLPTAQWNNYSTLDGLLEQVASTLKTHSSCTQANLITPKNQNYPLEWFWSEDSSQLADANGGFRIPQLEGLP